MAQKLESASADPLFRDDTHIPALDSVRGIAIISVMVLHFNLYYGLDDSNALVDSVFYQAASLGWAGVTLFFVLSGFLITRTFAVRREAPSSFETSMQGEC